MTSLETVAFDQERWRATARKLKFTNIDRLRMTVGLTIAGAILEALAAQIHTTHPVASEVAGYAGAFALVLVALVRVLLLRKDRVQAWVLASAAGQSLKSEMYYYRTCTGPYSDPIGGNPEATLLERRDEILEKVRFIQHYADEPDPKNVAALGPLDAEGYVSERLNDQIGMFRTFTQEMPVAQGGWIKLEYFMAIAGALLAAILTFTHNQAYGAWVAVVTTIGFSVGVDAMAERYALLTVGYRAVLARLTSILGHWQAHHLTLDQLVKLVETSLLTEGDAWVVGGYEFLKDTSTSPAQESPSKLDLYARTSRTGT
jgi:hypothetical protein